jgi:hypothetical protein
LILNIAEGVEVGAGFDARPGIVRPKTTRRGILVFPDAHVGEHLGQAIAYARMNGIVPPWSK